MRSQDFFAQDFNGSAVIEQVGLRVVRCFETQLVARRKQLLLQLQNAAAGPQASLQFEQIEWLGNVVVGARVKPFDDLILASFDRKQNDIEVEFLAEPANSSADLDAVHLGHDPIEHQKPRAIVLLGEVQSLGAIGGDYRLVAE